jgi:di/tricarboxylate transporter
VVRRTLGRVRLEQGDVLLLAGSVASVNNMRHNTDLIVLSGSKQDLPVPKKAPLAAAIFLGAVAMAASGLLSIPVAAIAGSVLMIGTGCLNIRQATRAIDRKIFLLVGSMLAIGTALQATDGAQFIANFLLDLPLPGGNLAMAAMLFILVAITTNILTNNACAILFTPIALNMAVNLGIDPIFFAITVVFAANCSFASPMGYQTNLLVMGPGHYRFKDFMIAGIPLVLILWGTYIALAKFYFGL